MTEETPSNKYKIIKISILKRQKEVEEKKGSGETTTFGWHKSKTVVKNLAFWKIAERGIITPDDVNTAIYQLEKANLVEIIEHNKLRLTPKGRQIAREIRTMKPEVVPDHLLDGYITDATVKPEEHICPKCGKIFSQNSLYCEYCGTKTQRVDEFCTYCGELIKSGTEFCSKCGKKT